MLLNNSAGAEVLCEVKSDLSTIEEGRFKLKNRHCKTFKLVRFCILLTYLRVEYRQAEVQTL